MKYIVVLVVLLVAVWIWRRSRAEQAREDAEERAQEQAQARARQAPPPQVLAPAEMVSCAHCGLHLPAADALTGPGGHFCSAEHQRQHGQ